MTDGPSSGGRPPHDWDEVYRGGSVPLPWDIGRPQPVFVALLDAGRIKGRVLDAGCGTGEHALMAAERGMDATGIDVSSNAIAMAERKAAERGLSARFVTGDALKLGELGEQFDTALDCGLFHSFDDEQRPLYVASLHDVVKPGGRVLLCCFSNEQPGDWGPRRVHQDELRAAFASGWNIESIEPAQLEVNLDPPTALAWLMTATRVS
jgi:cyclopropane fatty-acyl-phospholipid synthase-like methyltransferase